MLYENECKLMAAWMVKDVLKQNSMVCKMVRRNNKVYKIYCTFPKTCMIHINRLKEIVYSDVVADIISAHTDTNRIRTAGPQSERV